MCIQTRRRPGMTLMELMVVIVLILVLAGLGFAFIPNLDRNKGVPNAVTQVEGWINLSKQQALRDHRPHGIRLIHDGNGHCTSLQYIEQPDPIAPRGPGLFLALYRDVDAMMQPTGPTKAILLQRDNMGNPQPSQWEGVEIGDFLELSGEVTGTSLVTGVAGATLTLDRIIDGTELAVAASPVSMVNGFKVIRSPRPLVGEPMLQMHRDVYIDLTGCYPCPLNPLFWVPPPPFAGYSFNASWGPKPIPLAEQKTGDVNYIDILFNSSGVVANAPTGQYILTVRHIDRPTDVLLVCIYTRTGKITAHSAVVDIPGANPYVFTRDGNSPGL